MPDTPYRITWPGIANPSIATNAGIYPVGVLAFREQIRGGRYLLPSVLSGLVLGRARALEAGSVYLEAASE